MAKIVLISCVSKKLGCRSKAGSLYISPLFRYGLMYARSLNPDRIFILSAKYGLLGLDEEVEPYDETLNRMSSGEIKKWAEKVLNQLREKADLSKDEFVFLAGEKYRKYLIRCISKYYIPLEGLGIGKQLSYLKERAGVCEKCEKIHKLFNSMQKLRFPFDESKVPLNGIYVLFEKGEKAHEGDRIVRVGTHTGEGNLRSRLKEHFINENKDRSIFRKNIGRCLLKDDPFLKEWELTPLIRNVRIENPNIDFDKQREIEKEVTKCIQKNFSFVVFEVKDKKKRLEMESKIISTISLCGECKPSSNWFGLSSPKDKIVKSGLWLVNELYKKPLSGEDMEELKGIIFEGRE